MIKRYPDIILNIEGWYRDNHFKEPGIGLLKKLLKQAAISIDEFNQL
ncbi:MAG: hypothetical protein AB1765_03225 [Candidatus Hydrogenedentota bacterium]